MQIFPYGLRWGVCREMLYPIYVISCCSCIQLYYHSKSFCGKPTHST
jgi:hypothetical protein